MSDGYILRRAAYSIFNGEHNLYTWDEIEEAIDAIPAADVRPVVRARWEWKNTDALASFAWTCSACGQRKVFKTNFCPNCGADMRPEGGTDR